MAAITVCDAGGGGSGATTITTTGNTPTGDKTAVVATAIGATGYATALNYTDANGSALSAIGTPVDIDIFGVFHAYANFWYRAGPAAGIPLQLFGQWAGDISTGAISGVYVSGANQTQPFTSSNQTANGVGTTLTTDVGTTVTGRTPGDLIVALFDVQCTGGSGFTSITAVSGNLPSGGVGVGPFVENTINVAAVMYGTADANGSCTLSATVTVPTPGGFVGWCVQPLVVNADPNSVATVVGVFAQSGVAAVSLTYPVQRIRPASDVVVGEWLPSTANAALYAMIDEAVVDDTDYDYSNTVEAFTEFAVAFGAGNAPASNVGNLLSYRIRGDGVANMTVTLKETTTTIAQWNHTPAPLAYTTYTRELTALQVAGISNFSNLRIYFGVTP